MDEEPVSCCRDPVTEASAAQVSRRVKRAENRRSTAASVSHHQVERRTQLLDQTRRQVSMESYQRESMRRIRRNSQTLLQDLFSRGVHGGGRDTPIPAQRGRDAGMIHSIASLIRAQSKLLLLEGPDTVEIYKLNEPAAPSTGARKDNLYLPAITAKASSLTSLRGSLSQSCPYLYDKRRGSFSSVASQQTRDLAKRQSNLKAQREAKRSNVTVTMTYLGHGRRGSGLRSAPDELKVLQQVNGGENICVFKGSVRPGEQFQFVSQRHRGFPFSASLYVNGLVATRLSCCCEYRYAPGFQQGRKGCFRLTWLQGGAPCYRCTSLRNKYGSCQQLSHDTKENLILPAEWNPGNGATESRPSSPLFVPVKPEKTSVRRTRRQSKEGGAASTDSEERAAASKETSRKKRRKGQTRQKDRKSETAVKKSGAKGQDGGGGGGGLEASHGSAGTETRRGRAPSARAEQKQQKPQKQLKQLKQLEATVTRVAAPPPSTRRSSVPDSLQAVEEGEGPRGSRDGGRRRDFYAECVEMSGALEPSKHKWFKANILERCRLQKKLSSCPRAAGSDLEPSAESDAASQPEVEPEEEEEAANEPDGDQEPAKEQDLQAQLDAMMTVLSSSAEVGQLVLRNTDLTDDHLLSLAGALKSSQSEVTLLNLNLNRIGPYGAHILLDVLRAKPGVKGLHLFGNRLRDHGALALLTGVAELQEQTARAAAAAVQRALLHAEHGAVLQPPPGRSPFRAFTLLELDVGGNGLGSEAVRALAWFMRHHSQLQYLGLAQSSGADLAAWKELFDSMRGSASLAHVILDQNRLGDPGVRLLADVLRENAGLRELDLDGNDISDVGGNDIMGALLCRTQAPLRHLSLDENNISAGLMSRIQEEVKCK